MELKTLLDTDILSRLMRRDPAALKRAPVYLSLHPHLTISLVTRYEILRGLKAKNAVTQIAAFHAFCEMNVVPPMTDGIIVRASEIYAELRTRGRLIPDADILIAATAIENGLVLATNNLSDFSRISGLSCDNWVASN